MTPKQAYQILKQEIDPESLAKRVLEIEKAAYERGREDGLKVNVECNHCGDEITDNYDLCRNCAKAESEQG